MLFNSLEFGLFFPIVVLLYFVVPKKLRCLWLLVSSYFFYMCWNPKYAVLILTSTVISMSFPSMDTGSMAWLTLKCLIWQAVLALLATAAINGLTMFWFNRKGELRRRPPKKN